MTAVYFECPMSDDARRAALYGGQVVAYLPTPSSLAFVELARTMLRDAFGELDPEKAQCGMAVEDYARVLADLKPRFIHHPRSKECIQGILREMGCDLHQTYFDVPRMRSATSDDFLSSGIAYAFHPHRDCWYSAPFCQINFWIPIYAIQPDNVMAFHPRYWSQPVRNGSRDYNYAEWNRTSRHNAAQFIKEDTRIQPKPEEPIELDPQIRVIVPPGGILMFSGAQMHSTVPNTSGRTRFSIDFRTVHLEDVAARRGAANVDSECTGTTMRDYLRGTDLAHVPEELIALYDTPPRSESAGTGAGPASPMLDT
jgi:hypothetical protein